MSTFDMLFHRFVLWQYPVAILAISASMKFNVSGQRQKCSNLFMAEIALEFQGSLL